MLEVQFLNTEFSAEESEVTKTISFRIDNPITVDTHFFVIPMTYQDFDDKYELLNATYPGLDLFTLNDEYDQAEGKYVYVIIKNCNLLSLMA